MRVLVVGAAGRTGRAVVERAAAEGHEVTAFVYSDHGNGLPGVRVLVGDAGDAAAVDAGVRGQDAVIDTVGGKTPYRRTDLEASAAAVIVAAMQRHGARRLVVTSSLGVGESAKHTPPLTKVVVATFLRGSTADKAAMEAVVSGSGLDWVIARPAVLTDGPATGQVRALAPGDRGRAKGISRPDLAAFLVAQLTSNDHLLRAVTLATR